MTSKASNDADDLDSYLDDVLDDFNAPPPPAAPATAASNEATFDDDFAKQLASNMEALLKGNFDGSGAGGSDMDATMSQIMDTFKDLNVDPSAATAPPVTAKAASSSADVAAGPQQAKSFQDTIANTMQKLRTSSSQVDQQVAEDAKLSSMTGGMSEEAMEQMMRELEGMMSSGEFDNVFGGLMDQLMSKELLYEPMKDLAGKYPEWIAKNRGKLPADEMEKYERQHQYIKDIVLVYDESSSNSLTEEEESKKVADLMQKMQECGNPPEEILQDLAPGLEVGADGIPKLPGSAAGQECNIM
ncbi:Pex19 protein [Phlyctochytrium arcticum]|nr:Pex19 protein [Phlyctochytrium arcticum]